ncbi:hypothetical protein BLNAU_6886 [Blattamonas nauphoetae]|uniref:Right handed beta helix domain-containing protein n=1 Tax=Blattamonas nauphoetae TaxID=2049346 RepID=A0ABQ9Y370_9EUKA|nr:hypothetical protein BLNAU_6886 [Blattamonas nauphoetae]
MLIYSLISLICSLETDILLTDIIPQPLTENLTLSLLEVDYIGEGIIFDNFFVYLEGTGPDTVLKSSTAGGVVEIPEERNEDALLPIFTIRTSNTEIVQFFLTIEDGRYFAALDGYGSLRLSQFRLSTNLVNTPLFHVELGSLYLEDSKLDFLLLYAPLVEAVEPPPIDPEIEGMWFVGPIMKPHISLDNMTFEQAKVERNTRLIAFDHVQSITLRNSLFDRVHYFGDDEFEPQVTTDMIELQVVNTTFLNVTNALTGILCQHRVEIVNIEDSKFLVGHELSSHDSESFIAPHCTITRCTFRDIHRQNPLDFFSFYSAESVVVEESTFENIRSDYPGGALVLTDVATVEIKGCAFLNCSSAFEGGGAFLLKGCGEDHVDISETLFERNSMPEMVEHTYGPLAHGGAILIQSVKGQIKISNCIFSENGYYYKRNQTIKAEQEEEEVETKERPHRGKGKHHGDEEHHRNKTHEEHHEHHKMNKADSHDALRQHLCGGAIAVIEKPFTSFNPLVSIVDSTFADNEGYGAVFIGEAFSYGEYLYLDNNEFLDGQTILYGYPVGRKATCEGCVRNIALGFTAIFVSIFVVISTLVLICCCCCCYHHHKKESQTQTPAQQQIRPQTVYLPPPPQPVQPNAYYPPAPTYPPLPVYYPSAPQQQQVLMYPPPVAYAVPTQVPPPTAVRPTYSAVLINKE